jgi:hypothetical protein
MNLRKAVKIAIEAMRQKRQEYAFDAHMAERMTGHTPGTDRAKQKYDELTEAMRALEELK